jgi:uncharacterized lipoprotein YmbA
MKLKIILGITLTLCLGACFSSPSSRFYMLNAIQQSPPSGMAAAEQNSLSICVGPVLLAEYLDRKQICTREDGHEVKYAEYHRWAEPLDAGLSRVLVENLSLLLGTSRIDVFPWKSPAPADYQVRIMLLRFNGEPGGQAVLKARWSLEAAGQKEPVADRITSIIEPVESGNYEDLVKAQNKALDKMSHEIAGAIQQALGHR